jgi:hypothetical protein
MIQNSGRLTAWWLSLDVFFKKKRGKKQYLPNTTHNGHKILEIQSAKAKNFKNP